MEKYLEIFEEFKKEFLENKKSAFSGNVVLSEENIKFLYDNFNSKPDAADNSSFDEKIKRQLKEATADQIDLFANINWHGD